MRKRRVVLASSNPGKLRELQALLPPDVEVISATDAGVALPPETGSTFAENALLKARAAAEQAGMIAIADDSGLEVDALGGEPGVHSARYAGPQASDADNIALLLKRLEGMPAERRTARFPMAPSSSAKASSRARSCLRRVGAEGSATIQSFGPWARIARLPK